MRQDIMSVAETARCIEEGKVLLLAGDEGLLKQLPKGKWIGGSIPYFISNAEGGLATREKIFVTDVSQTVADVEAVKYDAKGLPSVYSDGPENGFSFIIIPALSKAHLDFALNAPSYKDFGVRPVVGWISGVHLDDLGKVGPKAFLGTTGEAFEEGAVVMQARMKPGKVAEVGIINLFEQGGGDSLRFNADGFSASEVLVNGEPRNFAEYIGEKNLDTKLPLVADYYGSMINISFQAVDAAKGEVTFYAPVFAGVDYKHASPVPDYGASFAATLQNQGGLDEQRVVFSCNCILNYLYSGLEGKKTTPFAGPITFGEIAYQLLNQTLVYLEVHDI